MAGKTEEPLYLSGQDASIRTFVDQFDVGASL